MTVRLYPTRSQASALNHHMFLGRVAYNRALAARIHWYKTSGKSLSYYDQTADLTELRNSDPFWGDGVYAIQRDALRRLDKSYKAFFRRVKAGEKPGFPRFKGRNRWNSFTISQPHNPIEEEKIRVCKVDGLIRTRNLRPIDGKIKEQRILRRASKWYCQLTIESADNSTPARLVVNATGIDLGIKTFAVLSDGTEIANPRFGKQLARKLAHANRNLSRTKKGSKNRRKAIARLQAIYAKISDHRSNFTHHVSKEIATKYDLVAVENLTVANMARGRLAKSILDACWSQFLFQLAYKVENTGGLFVKVDPRNTSQDCSQCGERVPKDLSVRIHSCPKCGLVLCRDQNAARNVLLRALSLAQHPPAVGRAVMPVEGFIGASLNQEVSV